MATKGQELFANLKMVATSNLGATIVKVCIVTSRSLAG